MGAYNPYQPQILGQEWVPIRDEDTVFSPAVNAVELGHGFTLATSQQVNNARMYVNTPGAGISTGQTFMAAVYSRGTEDQSGPIERVLIPVNSGGVTGNAAISGSSLASALLTPSDTGWVLISPGSSATALYFATNAYAAPLVGKRILGVNLYYTAAYAPFEDPSDITIAIEDNAGNQALFGDLDIASDVVTEPYLRSRFGEVCAFWSTTLGINTNDRMPWRYPTLQRLEASSANRLQVVIRGASTNASIVRLGYAALEVIYCEELRLAVGGRAANLPASSPVPLRLGANTITMRTIDESSNPILAAGDYTVVLSSADVGDSEEFITSPASASQYPFLNAVRELYDLPTHPGVQVDIPFPVEEHVGDTFSVVTTHVLPQISLHATGGTLTEPHAYGRQAAAEVWGSNTATQELYDDVVGVATVYQQVRYVARRFGDTTVPLTLTGTASLAGSSVTITVDEFDALTEIIDGWKEVTLRFDTPPTMGTLATPEPSWTWSAAGETAGNRWEILAACAPAISGVAGNLFNQVIAADQLYGATYEPPAGAQAELTWMPQGVASPYVTGATEDDATDAFLIFSQDPPTVTGVTLTAQTQTVTGIGFMCGQLPCCIPSGIAYQRITWSPTSMPVSAFGAYELQRFDTAPGADFETIMLATSPYVTGFNDYEARVGLDSVYRLRTLNIYNFAGAWSAQVTGAPPTPGVTGGCDDQTGALIFTSNSDQSGASNAAYVMQWDGSPVEDFALPEADEVVFQALYGRDGVVAFHGTERGLEEFSRALLIQAAAIDPIRLADVKTLRDLAWADLPYICVRDDLGDRWFANVQVPTVNARLNRTVYMARVDIRELTRTPYAVDP